MTFNTTVFFAFFPFIRKYISIHCLYTETTSILQPSKQGTSEKEPAESFFLLIFFLLFLFQPLAKLFFNTFSLN